jgi:23S rRNA (adenine2030-N6)-methyltransferase
MNYRHAFHAGNHADVLKHAALVLTLERLKAKAKPFFVLDTHAGRGAYDLAGAEAFRSAEYVAGAARLAGDAAAPDALAPYLDLLRRHNPFGGLRWYPGSPMIIRDALRPEDSAKFCELQPDERAALEAAIGSEPRIRIYARDGYQAVRAFLPPTERRGLVLIDPPFEQPGEFDRLAAAAADGLKRWANGIYLMWRPIKDDAGHRRFAAAMAALAPENTLDAELSIAPKREGRLTGSGLYFINPPFGIADGLAALLPYLARRLAQAPGGGWSLVETEKGRAIRAAGETLREG